MKQSKSKAAGKKGHSERKYMIIEYGDKNFSRDAMGVSLAFKRLSTAKAEARFYGDSKVVRVQIKELMGR